MSVGSSYILKRVEIAVGKSKVHNDLPLRLRKRISAGVSESFTKRNRNPHPGIHNFTDSLPNRLDLNNTTRYGITFA
jgi:hypothetical protein